jgi:hypothetical protein
MDDPMPTGKDERQKVRGSGLHVHSLDDGLSSLVFGKFPHRVP